MIQTNNLVDGRQTTGTMKTFEPEHYIHTGKNLLLKSCEAVLKEMPEMKANLYPLQFSIPILLLCWMNL